MIRYRNPFAPLFALLLAASAAFAQPAEPAAGDYAARGRQLAIDALIVDTHVDVPYRLQEKMEDISVRTASGDFDYPRAVEGGLDAPFMSIYVPAALQETPGASKKLADELIDMVEKFVRDWPDKFALAYTPADLLANRITGRISLPMGMENGAPIENDLANVEHFHGRGIRYITLTHGKDNQICDSSYSPPGERKWKGLSPFGKQVVAEMNRVGIMIDVSHVSDDTFDQVIALSKAPLLVSHSSARHFTPGFERNLDDARIKKLAKKGGVIDINFGSSFLTEAANKWSVEAWAKQTAHFKENGIKDGSPEAKAWEEQYRKDNPLPYATLDDVVAHIDHVAKIAGIDHVGLGSDFDGVGDSLPVGLKSVADYPNLVAKLLEKGYSETEVKKILGGNVVRVWREVERVAADLQKSTPKAAAKKD
jgi:membrane dipeptidase